VISADRRSALRALLIDGLEEATRSLGARAAAIGIIEHSLKVVRTVAVVGLPPRSLEADTPLDRGLAGQVIASGKAMTVPRYGDFAPGVLPDFATHAACGIPIGQSGVALGALGFWADSAKKLSPSALAGVDWYVRQAAALMAWFQRLEHKEQVAVQAERRQIARELHDNLTQTLASIHLLTRAIGASPAPLSPPINDALKRLGPLAHTAFAEARHMIERLEEKPAGRQISRKGRSLLGSEQLQAGGLELALKRLLPNLLPPSTALDLRLSNYVLQAVEREEALLRVCQEAVSNALKHGRASKIRLEVALQPTQVQLSVDDNGVGMQPHAPIKGSGFGLNNMRERLQELGGLLETGRSTLGGFHLRATLPRQDRTHD
jgi:two-component system, NarL family, sensor kinase